MSVDKPSGSEPESTAGNKSTQAKAALALKLALGSMNGHADHATLGEVHRGALERFDIRLTIEEAADMLTQMNGVQVERAPLIEQSRVFAPTYWRRGQ